MKKKSYIFSEISFNILDEIAYFDQVQNQKIFREWFNVNYEISESDEKFLNILIKNNFYNIDFYSELQCKLHFISPLLNRINFYGANYRQWFEAKMQGIIN